MEEEVQPVEKRSRSNPILNIFFIICFSGIFLYYMLSAPISSQSIANRQGILIHVAKNETLATITNELEVKKVVRQSIVLKLFVKVFKFGHPIARGDYLFKDRMPVWQVAWMLARGEHNVDPIRVTLKEGMTTDEMAKVLADKLSSFRRDLFLSDPRSKQGYLFPDTYFFFSLTTSDEILDEINSNYKKHMASLTPDIEKSGHSVDEIVVMASIIQKEALGESDASTISGILWKRIKAGMPLQVDASRDTYKEKGLPQNPISNPGLIALSAAAHPTDSNYLYYLHDKNGIVHYASTYAEHQKNINKYLR